MVSLETWPDGFLLTAMGSRILMHSGAEPALLVGKPGRKGASGGKENSSWSPPGAFRVICEKEGLYAIRFGEFTLRARPEGRILRLRFDGNGNGNGAMGLLVRFSARPEEKLFGLEPSSLFDLKSAKGWVRRDGTGPGAEKSSVVFSDRGDWMKADGGGSLEFGFEREKTLLAASRLPVEVSFGFGKDPLDGMELLVKDGRSLPGWKENDDNAGFPWPGGENAGVSDLLRPLLSIGFSGKEPSGFPSAPDRKNAAHMLDMGVFCPLPMAPAGNEASWSGASRGGNGTGQPLSRVVRALQLHEALTPYHAHCAGIRRGDGIPSIAHPALRFPADSGLWERDDEYMYGPDILVAPSLAGTPRARRLLLPAKEGAWVHFWTSRRYPSGEHVVDAPLGRPAVFYREESVFSALFDSMRLLAGRL